MKKESPKKDPKKEQVMPEPVAETPGRSAVAKLKHLRISPRKIRLVVDTVRFQPVGKAFRILMALKNKGARMAEKILKTAVANAKVLEMDETRLYVAEIKADGGPVMKRFMARSMGRADRILKRTSHLSVILKEGRRSWPGALTESGNAEEPKSGKAKLSSKKEAKAGGKKKAAAGAI
jgi:large subunit ribosomal protein L22